jgi:probable phosphoglycerate mutase
LVNQGIAEAQALGAYLKSVGIRALYVSPLERCQQTARIVARITGAPFRTLAELAELLPGETEESMRARFWPAFQTIWDASLTTGPLAAITHGGPIAFLLAELGMDAETLARSRIFDHRNPVPPGGVWCVRRPELDKSWGLSLVFTPNGSV